MADKDKETTTVSTTPSSSDHTSGKTETTSDDNIHTITWVTSDDGEQSLRASYDTNSQTGEITGAHFHDNKRK